MSQIVSKAILKFARLSPRKTRLVADLVRGKDFFIAETQLKWQKGKVAPVLLKLLRSAAANAEHNNKLNKEDLFVKSILVDAGPVLKRYTPKAFGRATPIRKPTSHISIFLASHKDLTPKKESLDKLEKNVDKVLKTDKKDRKIKTKLTTKKNKKPSVVKESENKVKDKK